MIHNSNTEANADLAVDFTNSHANPAAADAEVKRDQNSKSAISFGLPSTPATPWMTTRGFIIMVSLFHGLYAVKSLAEFVYQKDHLGLSPSLIQLISGIIFIPWCIKPVFGFIYDKLLLKLRRIRPIILTVTVTRIFCSVILAFFKVNTYVLVFIFLIYTLVSLVENICCESTLVKMTREENKKNPNQKSNQLPIYFGYRSFGVFIGTLVGGRIVKIYSIKVAFLISAFLSVLQIIFCLFYDEKVAPSSPSSGRSVKEELNVIKGLLTGDKIIEMAIFIFVLNLTPSFDQVSNFYLMEEHQFTEVDLADLQAFSIFCYVLGLAWYSYSLYAINPKNFYMATNVLYWVVNVSFLLLVLGFTEAWGLDAKIFCYLNYGFSSLIGELNFMPIIAIWCAVTPPDLEATSITLLTGLMNLAYNCSIYIGAAITYGFGIRQKHFEDFWLLVVIQNWYLIIVIIALFVIGFPDPTEKVEDSQTSKGKTDAAIELVN